MGTQNVCWRCGGLIQEGEGDGVVYASYPPKYAHRDCRNAGKVNAQREEIQRLQAELCHALETLDGATAVVVALEERHAYMADELAAARRLCGEAAVCIRQHAADECRGLETVQIDILERLEAEAAKEGAQ